MTNENLGYPNAGAKKHNTKLILLGVAALLVTLVLANLAYFLNSNVKQNTNASNSFQPLGIQQPSIPSVTEGNIEQTDSTPGLNVKFKALDSVKGVGEKCDQTHKFQTNITADSPGKASWQYIQSDGTKSEVFTQDFTAASLVWFGDYTWTNSKGEHTLEIAFTEPGVKSFKVGVINACVKAAGDTPGNSANVSSNISSITASKGPSLTSSHPSSVEDIIAATETTPEIKLSLAALDKVIGVGESCLKKQKIVTKLSSSDGSQVKWNYEQSDGYKTNDFGFQASEEAKEYNNAYEWDTAHGSHIFTMNITHPVQKSYTIGFVNECNQ